MLRARLRGKRRRCLRVRHRCPCAFPRGRSTGLGVAGFAIRSRRGRHRPRALPRSQCSKPERADPSAYEAARQPGPRQRPATRSKRPGPPLCAACEEKSVTGYCRQTRERNDIEWARATGTAPPSTMRATAGRTYCCCVLVSYRARSRAANTPRGGGVLESGSQRRARTRSSEPARHELMSERWRSFTL